MKGTTNQRITHLHASMESVRAKRWVTSRRLVGGAVGMLIGFCTIPAGATVLSDLAAQMQPGQWRQLVTIGFGQGAMLQANDFGASILEYTDEAVRNPFTKKIYVIGCAREGDYDCATTGSPSAGWVEYDEPTNTWKRMPSTSIDTAFHGYNHATIDPATGFYYYWQMSPSRVARYANGVLSTLPAINSSFPPQYTALKFFPERNSLVLVNARDVPSRLHSYNLGTGVWTSQQVALPTGIHQIAKYSAVHKILYFGGGTNSSNMLFKMDAQGNVTRAADAPVTMGTSSSCPIHVVDPVSGNLLVMSASGSIHEYDPVRNTWLAAGSHSLRGASELRAVAVPVPELGVIFVAKWDSGGGSSVWLYKHSPGVALPADTTPPTAPLGFAVQ